MDLRLASVSYNDNQPSEALIRLFIHESVEERRATGTIDVTVTDENIKVWSLLELEEEAIKIAHARIA